MTKESKKNILNRGIEKNVVLKQNANVRNIVADLLSDPFHDRVEVLKLQHCMYKDMMSLEEKCMER